MAANFDEDAIQARHEQDRLDAKCLREQLETARKALEGFLKRVLSADPHIYPSEFAEALAQIGAGRPPVQPCGHEWRGQAEQNRIDAERYGKLKTWLVSKQEGRWIRIGSHYFEKSGSSFDSAVDTLDVPDALEG